MLASSQGKPKILSRGGLEGKRTLKEKCASKRNEFFRRPTKSNCILEASFLLGFLPAYVQYLTTHANSLLVKFLGSSVILCYSVCVRCYDWRSAIVENLL